MLDKSAIADLRQALEGLKEAGACCPVEALPALERLGGQGLDVAIDLKASESLGAAVIVAKEPARTAAILLAPLTPRQREVAVLILAGQSNKQIARELGLSLGTVKDHVHAILEKLDLRSRSQLISAALSHKT